MNNQATIVCPVCGNVEPATNGFCSKCGAPMAKAAPQPAPQTAAPQTNAPQNASKPAEQSGAPAYTQQPQYNPYYNQSAKPPMEKKKMFFFGGLGGAGLYLFCNLLVDFASLVGGYGRWMYFFQLLSAVGLAASLGALFLYIKELLEEKK